MTDTFKYNLTNCKFKSPSDYADKLFDHLSNDNVKLIRLSQTIWIVPSKDKLVKEIILREKMSSKNLECFFSIFKERFDSKIEYLKIIKDPFNENKNISSDGICIEYNNYLNLIN